MSESQLIQPLLSVEPEYGHLKSDVLSLEEFLYLLRDEEAYFQNDLDNTAVLTTRLRKIFYDKWGWDTQLIRKAASIKGRFEVTIINCSAGIVDSDRMFKKIKFYVNNTYTPKCRHVTYRSDDVIYRNTSRVGQVPEIFDRDHADVLLPEGYHCDIGHVLAGLDALNNPDIVTPLPDCMRFFYWALPYADSNADVATWLGDIATSGADFLFTYLKNNSKPLNIETEQNLINMNATASDMLGNIDAYVIHILCKKETIKSKRISDIFKAYYDNAAGSPLYAQRYKLFTEFIGLGELNNNKFENEDAWLTYYENQLRSTIAFMIYSSTDGSLDRLSLPYKVWKKQYEEVIKINVLLNIFLKALKTVM